LEREFGNAAVRKVDTYEQTPGQKKARLATGLILISASGGQPALIAIFFSAVI
jgi:hypothetical protein